MTATPSPAKCYGASSGSITFNLDASPDFLFNYTVQNTATSAQVASGFLGTGGTPVVVSNLPAGTFSVSVVQVF